MPGFKKVFKLGLFQRYHLRVAKCSTRANIFAKTAPPRLDRFFAQRLRPCPPRRRPLAFEGLNHLRRALRLPGVYLAEALPRVVGGFHVRAQTGFVCISVISPRFCIWLARVQFFRLSYWHWCRSWQVIRWLWAALWAWF